jgi:hypothetical protein
MIESRKIAATSEQVAEHNAGPILTVAFAGNYPSGSDGNNCSAEMVSYLRSILVTTNAAAVILDLRRLQYIWGDAIGGLALALGVDAPRFRPSAIVASGPTARSLEPLLGAQFIFGVVGTRMFSTIPEALNHLEQVLGQESG